MNRFIFTVLKKYADNTRAVNRIIISAFIKSNQINGISNRSILNLIVNDYEPEASDLNEFLEHLPETGMSFENMIELFEFVISPSDKLVNGAVYTPKRIRQHIVENSISIYRGNIGEIKAADLSCGCGGFLLTLSEEIYRLSDKSYSEIFRENIYGVDIADYSIERSRILLTIFAIVNGEDKAEFEFNLHTANSLSSEWKELCTEAMSIGGFDLIVGNPPYVCSRNMDTETLKLTQNWEVAKSGHPDLYIPFFQIGIENLNYLGVLGYITVNTFVKSINGRALREYFAKHEISLSILNFGGEQIFQDRNTYTCICYASRKKGNVKYIRTTSSELESIDLAALNEFSYRDLSNKDGWSLVNDASSTDFLKIIENTGQPFKKLYTTRNGIATLKNDVYKFVPERVDKKFYYLNDKGIIYPIEKGICRNIVNANKLKNEADIRRLREQIIFPYDSKTTIIPESIMKSNYPMTYDYLNTKRPLLSKRDKGTKKYEVWYAYGRRQSMDINAYKLFFPHICERPTFVICEDKDLLFYNGIAVVSENIESLVIIKKILESNLFYKYIQHTTKDYASGYISMSRNHMKNFGVLQLDEEQQKNLLDTGNSNEFLEELYALTDGT